MADIPLKIEQYNIYDDNNDGKLIGAGEELTNPSLENTTTTIRGAGILGEIEDPTPGDFGTVEVELQFRLFEKESANMLETTKAVALTVRGAERSADNDGNITRKQIREVIRGRCTKLALGKLKNGETMDVTVTISIHYLLVEVDGESLIELDKLASVYKVNGVDQLAEIKEMC